MHPTPAQPTSDDPGSGGAPPVTTRRRARAGVAVGAALGLLVGMAGAGGAAGSFSDVPPSHPFHEEITWMSATGITTGFTDGTFRPGQPVTRQSMSAFLQRSYNLRDDFAAVSSSGVVNMPGSSVYVDVPGMTRTVTVPPGTTASIVARFGAASSCRDNGGALCYVQILRNGSPMGPSTSAIFDQHDGGTDPYEARMIERWSSNVGPGTYTIKVQGRAQPGATGLLLADLSLTVQVILDPA